MLAAQIAAVPGADDVLGSITTAAASQGTTFAAIGAAGVGLSLAVMVWPKAVAFFKKTAKV